MVRRAVAVLVVTVLAVGAAGCHKSDHATVVLDGRTRYPDAEGVLTFASVKEMRLAGGPAYRVSPKLQAFSTYTLQATPYLSRRNQYVQLGLDGRTVVWLAGIGAVVRAPGRPPTVFYTGRVKAAPKGRVVFADGTVFRLGAGVAAPSVGARVQVDLDPSAGRVRSFTVFTS
jgi:hypothetical protein